VTPTQLADLLATVPAGTPLGDWAIRHFGGFEFTGGSVAAPTVTFRDAYEVAVGSTSVRLVVGPAHTGGDVIARVPDEGVVFAGDVVFVGAHPAVWAGSVPGWAKACQTIPDTGAATIVGGHGPPTDPCSAGAYPKPAGRSDRPKPR
jgi:cyclase